ncbi:MULTISPECIES: hypothetical protein [Paraburkholderia]|uniref:Uncharacterized protein n=2 Tax=Paraburkholderia TaxID=1822464 RepID=A0A6J5FP67_9BURK|nr:MULTISPECIES: hypothetical protein [Paraburkholderia]GGC65395.1 hypothetical protein GCM10011400_61760 [Paraburkholderia caffeinilytica]CAB3781813.1 hypothetical protein LMG28688_01335 [Paraburkholderia caffeinitolerans]CAB3802293.1 hypothetical protein LMG28690_05538 [Paraburkholderia caffeinilytica]
MAAKQSAKAEAWVIFDRIVSLAAPGGVHSNPWIKNADGQLRFEPDYTTLVKLLGVPLYLKAGTQSGVPALALDVWLSYELRRAGFDSDQAWPRPVHPRILPAAVAYLLKALPRKIRDAVADRVNNQASIPGVTSSSASILGKNYLKQVDVIITDWATGPELLISTKRMDSSYGKNAPNRIEESYGDAKNLRLRHPLAALGFVFGLRSDILQKEPKTADWLFDLLAKLGREDDAYHATCLVLMEYSDDAAIPDTGEERPAEGVPEPGPELVEEEDAPAPTPESEVDREIAELPKVTILEEKIPEDLAPGRFLAAMVTRVLGATPVNMHEEARQRRASPGLR